MNERRARDIGTAHISGPFAIREVTYVDFRVKSDALCGLVDPKVRCLVKIHQMQQGIRVGAVPIVAGKEAKFAAPFQ